MLTTGRKIAGVIGFVYLTVFCVAAVLGHGPEATTGHTPHDSVCDAVLDQATELSVANKSIARALQEIKVGVQESGLEKLGWLYVKQSRETADEKYLEFGRRVATCLLHRDEASLSGKLLLGHTLHQQHHFKGVRSHSP